MQPNDEFVVTISDIAFGGDGVARLPEGGVVFVPYAALGDVLRVRIKSVRKSFAFGDIIDVVTPGAGRCEPLCPHYGDCGGCQYQHIGYEQELQAKRKQLGDVLQRIGGFRELPAIEPCFASPSQYGYRNKFRLEVSQRPRQPEDGEGGRKVLEYGYYRLDNRTVLPIHKCALVCDELNALLRGALKSEWAKQNAKRADKDGVEPKKPSPRGGHFNDGPGALTLRQTSDGDHAFYFGHAPKNLPWLREKLGDIEYSVPVGSFWQVNPAVATKLVQTVGSWIAGVPWLTSLIDAYSGVGTFAAALKYPFVERLLIESDAQATAAAQLNMGKANLAHQIVSDTTERALPKLLPKYPGGSTLVLLDPPRTGCDDKVIAALLKNHPRAVVYVSCNPSTLARDLKKLSAGGYALSRVGLFDMFPRTAHFETAALLLWQ